MEKMLLDKTIIASSCLVWFSKLGYTFYIIVIIFWNISLFFCLLFLHVNKVKMWSLENVPIVTKLTMKKLLIKATKENNYKMADSNIETSSNWLATTNRMKDKRSCFSSRWDSQRKLSLHGCNCSLCRNNFRPPAWPQTPGQERVERDLVGFEAISFAFFLLSSLVDQEMKLAINLLK